MKIKRDYKKLVNELIKIRPQIIIDMIVNLYTLATLRKDFGLFFDSDITTENFIHAVAQLAGIIVTEHPRGLEPIMEKIIIRNKKYIEFTGYHKFSLEKLIEEFQKDKTPSLHGEGVTPEMMILYFYAEGFYNHPFIPELINQYEISFQKSEKARQKISELFEFPSEPDITEIEKYLYEVEELQNIEDVDWHGIAKRFKCEYDEQTKTFSKVKRGLIVFYDTNIKVLKEMKASYETLFETFYTMAKRLYLSMEKQKQAWMHMSKLAQENRTLRSQVKALRKQLSELESKFKAVGKATAQTKDKQLTELLKENYYLKTRVEKLEQAVERLEQAQEINKEIVENLPEPEPVSIDKALTPPEYQTVVVVGGNWNSREKEALQQTLPTCEVKFIEAERTIARLDTISNADIVIFDTSRNAHKYYWIVKENARSLYLINKSSKDKVIELFTNRASSKQ